MKYLTLNKEGIQKSLITTFISILTLFSAFAQDFNNYKLLRSTGKVPEAFITSSTQKYQADVKKHLTKADGQSEKEDKRDFLLESNFEIDELLLSGKVLFNDPVTVYCNKIVDILLKDDPETRKNIQVYAIKSPVVNAMTTNSGIIFVNLGLIAQCENEAQLAYILTHEIIHYQKRHVIEGFMDRMKISKGKGLYRGASLDQKLVALSRHSKEMESEADIKGLDLYMKSNYSYEALDGVFDVLEYSYLPFDDVKFKYDFLETANYKIPKTYRLKELNEIDSKDEEDTLGTHPSVPIRRAAIADRVQNLENNGRQLYIVGKDDFKKVQTTTRYEISELYLKDRRYEAALYNTYLLLRDYPESIFLKKCVMKSLYGLSRYANDEDARFSEVHGNYNKIQGQSQQVYYLFEQMSAKEINVLATNYAWRVHKAIPGDSDVSAVTNELLGLMVWKYYPSISLFSMKPRPASLDSVQAADTAEVITKKVKKVAEDDDDDPTKTVKEGKSHKYVKLRKKNETEITSDTYLKYAFTDFLQDKEFKDAFEEKSKGKDAYDAKREKMLSPDYKREKAREARKKERQGFSLGIDKIVFVNPFYYKMDEVQDRSNLYIESEQAQRELNEKIRLNAARTGLNYSLIDKKDISQGGAESFNDIASITDWINENLDHGEMRIRSCQNADVQNLITKYGSKYFCWMGVASVKRKHHNPANFCGIFCCPNLAPFFAAALFGPKYETYFYTIVLNLATGEKVYSHVDKFAIRDRNDVLDASLYDYFNQMSTKK